MATIALVARPDRICTRPPPTAPVLTTTVLVVPPESTVTVALPLPLLITADSGRVSASATEVVTIDIRATSPLGNPWVPEAIVTVTG